MPFVPKPPAGSVLSGAHPHAQGLILCVPFLDGGGGAAAVGASAPIRFHDYGPLQRHGTPVVASGNFNPGYRVTSAGLGVHIDGPTSSEHISFGDSSLILPLSGGFSWVMGYMKSDTTARSTVMGADDSTPFTKRCLVTLPFSDGNVNFDFGGITNGSTQLQIAMPTPINSYAIWAFTTGDRGMEIWKDGRLLASNGANPSRLANTVAFTLGGSALFSNSDPADITFCYLYNRQLPTAIIQSLSVDPYAMLRRPLSRSFVLWATAGVPVYGAAVSIGAPTVAATGSETFSASGGATIDGPSTSGSGDVVIPPSGHASTPASGQLADLTQPLFWAAIRPSGELGDVYYGSTVALRDHYLGGFKPPRIAGIDPITRATSDFLTGALPAQTATVHWADHTSFIRNILGTVRSSWDHSEMWIYLVDNAVRLAEGDPTLLFYGFLKGSQLGEDMTYVTPAYDVFGADYSLLSNEMMLPKARITLDDFPGCPSGNVGLGVPIVAGTIFQRDLVYVATDAEEPLALIDVGDFTCRDSVVRRAMLVAGTMARVFNVVQNGQARAGFGITIWMYGQTGWSSIVPDPSVPYVVINDNWYTLVFLRGTAAAAFNSQSQAVFRGTVASAASTTVFTVGSGEAAQFQVTESITVQHAGSDSGTVVITHISGDTITVDPALSFVPVASDNVRSAFVLNVNQTDGRCYANVYGFDTVGDNSGPIMDDLLSLDRHIIKNFILGDWRAGAWLDSPTITDPTGGGSMSLLDEDSWDEASRVGATYNSNIPFKGAFVIGANGQLESARSVMANLAISGNFLRGLRHNGQIFVGMFDRDRTRFLSGRTTITDRTHILSGVRPAPQAQTDWLCNDYSYRYARNYRGDSSGDYMASGQQGDAESKILNGVVTRNEAFPMVRDDATANAVATQRFALRTEVPQIWTWLEPINGLAHNVLDGIAMTLYSGSGVGATGFVERGIWPLSQTIDPATCTVRFTGLDVERLLTG